MAWPPPVLPINRTNATPQLDTHAADHNAVNLAVNDIVDRINAFDNGGHLYFGSTPGGDTPVGGQITVATIPNLSIGWYLLNYTVLLSSTAPLQGTLRFFIGGVVFFDYRVRSTETSGSYSVGIPLNVAGAAKSLDVNCINEGAGVLSSYPVNTNHSIVAIRGAYLAAVQADMP